MSKPQDPKELYQKSATDRFVVSKQDPKTVAEVKNIITKLFFRNLNNVLSCTLYDETLRNEICQKIHTLQNGVTNLYKLNISSLPFKNKLFESFLKEELKKLVLRSDLERGVYEGGFKIWECSLDLINFLDDDSKSKIPAKNVLDCGCGHGVLGVYCLIAGAAHVSFQDYNEEVIKYFTIPTIFINLFPQLAKLQNLDGEPLIDAFIDIISQKCDFFWGDWSNLAASSSNAMNGIVPQRAFDSILSADTIYFADMHEKLLNFFNYCLKDGIVLIGAKSYYFGCDGSTQDFCYLAESENFSSIFEVCREKEIKNSFSNVREIISLKRK